MKTSEDYSKPQIILHWLIALVITIAWFTGDGMGRVLRARFESGATGFEGNTPHVWLGTIVFVLIGVRVILRLAKGAPGSLPGNSDLMNQAAEWGHRLLYILMIAVPALGALVWYAGINAAGELHEVVANALMIVALGHAAMAIWHHYVKGDGALNRMRLSSRK